MHRRQPRQRLPFGTYLSRLVAQAHVEDVFGQAGAGLGRRGGGEKGDGQEELHLEDLLSTDDAERAGEANEPERECNINHE